VRVADRRASSLALFGDLLAAVSFIGSAQAADDVNVSTGVTLAGPGLAAHGYDVVAFFTERKPVIGSDTYALAHKGGTYRFASQVNLDAQPGARRSRWRLKLQTREQGRSTSRYCRSGCVSPEDE
jgi:hypothetical protein